MAILTTASDIHLRSSQAMGLSAQSPLTISTWVNANWSAGGRRSFVGVYGPTTDIPLGTPITAMQIGTSNGTGELTCWTWGGDILVGTAAGVMAAFNNVWVHVAYTYDGVNHVLYRNGVQLATTTTAQIPGFLNQVYINGYPTSVTNEVDVFQVDQYNLYRRALSAGEVQAIYFAGGARHGITNALIARYEFDEGIQGSATTSVVDLSGNNHTLTSTGAGTPITYTYTSTLANSNIRPVQ